VSQEVILVVLAVIVIAVVAVAAWWAGSRRKSERLRERFGPEYERTVEAAPDRRRAEADLQARQDRVDALDIRPLDTQTRDRFRERWRVVQALFVDDPTSAIEQADQLIGEVMRARGYPVGDFEQRAADISVDHPQVVDHYRQAHDIAVQSRGGGTDTEGLRQAFIHYRALFSDLLEVADEGSTTSTSDAQPRPADREATSQTLRRT
jgi:FtsZ-interacting cell division protein ZipA